MLLTSFGIILVLITYLVLRKQIDNVVSFHVASRNVGLLQGALSIAVTWTWAPAVLVSAQKGFQQGLVGAFWFIAPNILALIVFAFFTTKFRDKSPNGYTLPNYMFTRYGSRVHTVYKLLMVTLNPMCFAIQLLAGGKILSFILGIDYSTGAIIVAIIVLSYTLLGGLKSTILTDILQQLLLIALILVVLPTAILKFNQLGFSVPDGVGGLSKVYNDIFSKDGWSVFLTYGLVQTIGLMAGPWGDQIYWHRVYAIEKTQVMKAFILGAIIFSITPISMAIFGFIGASGEINHAWKIKDAAIVNVEVISHLLPSWALSAFALILLGALATTMSSALSSFSSLVIVDFLNKKPGDVQNGPELIAYSRMSMVIVAIIGLVIALIPGMNLLYFFLFYTVIRASTLIPTAFTIVTENIDDSGIFYGIITALIIGTPTYAYGSITGQYIFNIFGALLTLIIPGLFILVFLRVQKRRMKFQEQARGI